MFFSLCRIDDWKPRIKKKTWQVAEQVELNRVKFTNVVIFNNKNRTFELFFYNNNLSLLKKTAWKFLSMLSIHYFFKMALSNFYARVFFNIWNTCPFSVLHNIKVCSHYNFLKPFLVYVVKIIEMAIRFHSNCRSASQVSYVAVRQWLEILINGFLIKNLGKYWHNVLLNS